MGKNLIQQRRGKGSLRFRTPKQNFYGDAKYAKLDSGEQLKGKIREILHCPAHSAPLLAVQYENGEVIKMISPENIKVGDEIFIGNNSPLKDGNVLPLDFLCRVTIHPLRAGIPGGDEPFASETENGFARRIHNGGQA